MTRRWNLLRLACVLALWALPGLPATRQTPETSTPAAPQQLAQTRANAPDDQAIENRIAAIFSQIDSLAHVEVDVREGVVSLDGNHLRIPNAMVFKAVILNYSRNPERRFEFDLGVGAEDDPIAAMTLGLDTLGNLPFVLK
jgi:hypothetical protein